MHINLAVQTIKPATINLDFTVMASYTGKRRKGGEERKAIHTFCKLDHFCKFPNAYAPSIHVRSYIDSMMVGIILV